MKQSIGVFFLATLLCSPNFGQQTSPSTPHGSSQDVPKQEPGTENPDVSKEHKNTPAAPGTNPSKDSGDVPQQKPGTDNPDIARRERSDDSSSTTEKGSKSKKKSSKGKKQSSTSTSY